MIDVLRNYPDTIAWLDSIGDEEIVLPAPVEMELIKGCKNRREVALLRAGLRSFRVYCPTPRDFACAVDILEMVHPSHNTGIIDALVAQCAISLQSPIVTFNVKHFKAIPGLEINCPYQKKEGFLQKILTPS